MYAIITVICSLRFKTGPLSAKFAVFTMILQNMTMTDLINNNFPFSIYSDFIEGANEINLAVENVYN